VTTAIEMLLMLIAVNISTNTVIYSTPLSSFFVGIFGCNVAGIFHGNDMFDLDKYLTELHIRSTKLIWV